MARIKETFDSRAWFRLECDDHNCEQRINDWYAYEDDLLFDAKDDGWQILYKVEHSGSRCVGLPRMWEHPTRTHTRRGGVVASMVGGYTAICGTS